MLVALVMGSAATILITSPSEATKPFFSFCFKLHLTAVDNAPTNFSLPGGNGSCPSGYHLSNETSPGQLINDMNALSKGSFNQGVQLGVFQESQNELTQHCLPSQAGCNG